MTDGPTDTNKQNSEVFSGPMVFCADVLGNLSALEAMIREANRKGATRYFVAGGLVLHGEHPLEVWKRLLSVNARLAKGTPDIAVCAVDPTRLRALHEKQQAALDKLRVTRTALGELILAHIRKLPDVLRIELQNGLEIAVVHGSPLDSTEQITHDMSDQEMLAMIGDDPADVVVCSGAGISFTREIGDLRIVGTGSVGGSPSGNYAHFAVITPTEQSVDVELSFAKYEGT